MEISSRDTQIDMIKLELQFNTIEELKSFIGGDRKAEVQTVFDLPTQVRHTIRKSKPWTEFEIDYIIGNWHGYTAKQIAASLGRSPGAVSQQAHSLMKRGLLRKKNNVNGKVTISNGENNG